jgi:hypothetical protein
LFCKKEEKTFLVLKIADLNQLGKFGEGVNTWLGDLNHGG